MKIEQDFVILIPIDRMYREMNNIGDIGYCLEGVKKVEVQSDTESRWVIEARAGFMARTFNLAGKITERRPPTYLSFTASGQDITLSGFFELSAIGTSETKCHAVVDCVVSGPFASVVELMAKGPQQQLIAKTIANVRQRLEAVAAGADAAELSAQAAAKLLQQHEPPSGRFRKLKTMLRRWIPGRQSV